MRPRGLAWGLAGLVSVPVVAGAADQAAPTPPPTFLPGPAKTPGLPANVATAIEESPAEQQARHVVEEWYRLRATGHGREAVEQYMAKDFVSHSHVRGLHQPKDGKSDYQRELEMAERMSSRSMPLPSGLTLEPVQMRVDDDLVTYYAGNIAVDIMRVKDGKITDHWDASPLDPQTLIGEKALLERADSGPPAAKPPSAPAGSK